MEIALPLLTTRAIDMAYFAAQYFAPRYFAPRYFSGGIQEQGAEVAFLASIVVSPLFNASIQMNLSVISAIAFKVSQSAVIDSIPLYSANVEIKPR